MPSPVLGLFQASIDDCTVYQLLHSQSFNIVDFENAVKAALDQATPRYIRRPYGFYDLNFVNSHPLLDAVTAPSDPKVCCPVYRVKFRYGALSYYIYYLHHMVGNTRNKYGFLILPIIAGQDHFTFLKDKIGVFAFSKNGYNRNRKEYMKLANSFHYFESNFYKKLCLRYYLERSCIALNRQHPK